jgi:kinesin family member 6/9
MSAIKVVCRLRPNYHGRVANIQLSGGSNNNNPCILVQQPDRVSIKSQSRVCANNNKDHSVFPVDAVLGENAGQGAVFDVAARETVDAFLSGYNGTIMCYGQTGAGKTYTLSGDHKSNDYNRRGVMPRVLEHVFQTLQEEDNNNNIDESKSTWTVRVSYLELYKEQLFDLLALSDVIDGEQRVEGKKTNSSAFDYSSSARSTILQGPSRLEVVETRSGTVHAKGCKATTVRTLEAALNLLFEGETNRVIAEHQLNAASSRSHCVFTVHLERQSNGTDGGDVGQSIRSKLRLVDLAGSERVFRTGSVGQTLQEAKYINTSLAFLEQMVVALGDKEQGKRDHVPYRSSKLTHLLKDCVGGNCLTVLIANIWPAMEHLHQTLSTLAFATRMRRIKMDPKMTFNDLEIGNGRIGSSSDQQKILNRYKREVRILREELAMRDSVAASQRNWVVGGSQSNLNKNATYLPLNGQEMITLRERVVSFVGEGPDGKNHQEDGLSGIFTVREIDSVYNMLREMILKERKRNSSCTENMKNTKKTNVAKREDKTKQNNCIDGDSPEDEEGIQYHWGQEEERILPSDLDSALRVVATKNDGTSGPPLSPDTSTLTPQLPPQHTSNNKNKLAKSFAFNSFKAENEMGIKMADNLKSAKREHRDFKAKVKKEIETANEAKQNIDATLLKLEKYRQKQEELRKGGTGLLEGEKYGDNGQVETAVIEVEEFELLKELKHWKRQYRASAGNVDDLKQRLIFLSGAVNRSREELVNTFDEWCRTNAEITNFGNNKKINNRSVLKSSSAHSLNKKPSAGKLAFKRAHSQRYERMTRINQLHAAKEQ